LCNHGYTIDKPMAQLVQRMETCELQRKGYECPLSGEGNAVCRIVSDHQWGSVSGNSDAE